MESIGRLATGIAHDFSNVLTVIIGDTEMALEAPAIDPKVKELLEEIGAASFRGASLTKQLMALAGRHELHPRAVSVNDSVKNAHQLFRRLLGEDIALELSLDPGAGHVMVDAAQFEVAVLNLALNARDAMPGGGRLTVATSQVSRAEHALRPDVPPGQYVSVTMTDTGADVDRSAAPGPLEPFLSAKGLSAGIGLGLATVYGIVKQFGGRIYVNAAAGSGSTFSIFLPPIDAPG